MHPHHSLYRYRPRHKPPLDAIAKLNWLTLVDWALNQPIESFVYTDEMMLEVGAPRGHKRITRERGEDPYQLPIHNMKKGNGFGIMVSGSISLGFRSSLDLAKGNSRRKARKCTGTPWRKSSNNRRHCTAASKCTNIWHWGTHLYPGS